MNTKSLYGTLIVAAALLATAPTAQAQHYPRGAEGIRGASLPPPGVYLRDYNYFYWADDGDGTPPGFSVFAYVNAPRVIWMTDAKILGASYGMDLIVPFGYQEVKAFGMRGTTFSLGDIQIEPLLLSWHTKQFDIAAGYAVWAPSGDYNPKALANIGLGYGSHMLTAGAVWNIDEKKTWAISMLNRYEINQEQEDTDLTPGQMWTLDWAVSKTVHQGVDVGVSGYFAQQTTKTTGSSTLAHVASVGPEVSAFIPQIGCFASARYLVEFGARNASEGSTCVVTLTKRF
jgi:hypothetical protein